MNFNQSTIIIFILFLGFHSTVFSQNTHIEKMAELRKKTIGSKSDQEKFLYNDSLQFNIYQFLAEENSFNTLLSGKIDYLGDIFSPDGAFRLITWNVSLKDGTHDYFCYVQLQPNDNGESKWFELIDKHKTIDRPDYKTLKLDKWYGCLYYTIIPVKINKEIAYTLLGWEGHNNYSTKKVIDILTFSSKGEPVFGKTVFQNEKHTKRRVVFEYSKEAYLMLRYNEDSKQIIFNRLEPPKPELEGLFSFYTPSLFYDAYEFKKGKWILHKDINPKNGKSNKPFHDPKKAPNPLKK